MSRSTTALARREGRRIDVSLRVKRWMGTDESPSERELAEDLGTSASKVQQWKDPSSSTSISVADAAGLPDPIRLELAQYIAGPGYAVVDLPVVAGGETADIRLLLSSQREHAQALDRFASAIEDGVLDASEAAIVERETDESLRDLLRIRERARAAQRTHGALVRRTS